MKYVKHISHLALAATLLIALASCAPSDDEGRIVIASLRGPSSVAMIQLIDSLANETETTVDVRIFDEPLQVRKMVLEGSADFAVLPSTMAALLYNRGIDYRMAAVPLWGTLYLCGNSALEQASAGREPILKGKRVYLMAKGMTPDVMFRHLLEKQGLEPERDLLLDYRFPTHIDLANAAIANLAPLCVLSEPYLSLALKSNPQLRILSDLSEQWVEYEGIPLAETAFVVRGAFAEESPETVDEIVMAYRHSGEWVKMHPQEAAALAVKYGVLQDEDAAFGSIPRSHIDVIPASDVEEELKAYLQVFYKMDPQIIGGSLPDGKFYEY